MNSQLFDFAIIGAGQAGPPLASSLAQANKKVVLIERKHLGGSCINFGCLPTKAAIWSAQVSHLASRASEFGIKVQSVEIDFESVIKRANQISQNVRQNLDKRYEHRSNPILIRGQGRLDGRTDQGFRLTVGEQTLEARQVILDTGSRTAIPPIEGLDRIPIIEAGNWLHQTDLPKHIAIIGGGYIAAEMAQFYRRMGSQVTVVERSSRILRQEDDDIIDFIQQFLVAEGIEFKFNTTVQSVNQSGDLIDLHLRTNGKPSALTVSHIFLATGRRPNIDDLGLETVGLPSDKHLTVNVHSETEVKGIFAVGDIRGGPMFTHTSWDDHRIVLSKLLGDESHTTHRVVPYAIFTDPELGRVGLTERQARAYGHQIKVGRAEMSADIRAMDLGETSGFIKVIVDADNDQILGAAVLACGGGDLVHSYIDLMNAKAPFTVLRDAVHIHPTLYESVQSAVSSIESTLERQRQKPQAA